MVRECSALAHRVVDAVEIDSGQRVIVSEDLHFEELSQRMQINVLL